MSTTDEEQKMNDWTQNYHNCCDNGQHDQADMIKNDLQQFIESQISDSQAFQCGSSCDDNKDHN